MIILESCCCRLRTVATVSSPPCSSRRKRGRAVGSLILPACVVIRRLLPAVRSRPMRREDFARPRCRRTPCFGAGRRAAPIQPCARWPSVQRDADAAEDAFDALVARVRVLHFVAAPGDADSRGSAPMASRHSVASSFTEYGVSAPMLKTSLHAPGTSTRPRDQRRDVVDVAEGARLRRRRRRSSSARRCMIWFMKMPITLR